MTWTLEGQQGAEAQKCMWDLVPFMRGRALDLGCGPYKAFRHMTGIDNCKDTQLFGIQMKPDVVGDVADLSMFASCSMDMVFSSHTLEHIEFDKVPATLKEWMRVLKQGGHLILYLPSEDEYPRCSGKDEWRDWFERSGGGFPDTVAAVEAFATIRRARGETKIGTIYAGTPFANSDHKWDVSYDKIVAAMETVPWGWDLVEFENRNEGNEYSLWFVFKRL